jgi:hypothetical protein
MTILQRFSLLRRRFSPLEERLIAAVREVLPPQAQPTFDAQVAGITLVQRPLGWNEINFYRRRHGKVDWSDIPAFPHTGEFPLAEVRFSAAGKRYKATLTSIGGHIFDFAITPSPKAIAFVSWDGSPCPRLLTDPLVAQSSRAPQPVPPAWRELLARRPRQQIGGWTLYDTDTAYRTTLREGEFVILAERAGDEFVMHRVEPAASELYYLASHDGTPEPIKGPLDDVFQKTGKGKL